MTPSAAGCRGGCRGPFRGLLAAARCCWELPGIAGDTACTFLRAPRTSKVLPGKLTEGAAGGVFKALMVKGLPEAGDCCVSCRVGC